MTDRELLELAAKAGGIKVLRDPHGVWRNCTGLDPAMNIFAAPQWNPLTDDGDNARLEAELGLNVIWGERAVRVGRKLIVVNKDGPMVERYQDHGGDRQKARRWAAVRAAAEIESRNKK